MPRTSDSMAPGTEVSLRLNGEPRTVGIQTRWRLLDLLREGLGLTGAKEGCDDGTCGTCTVIVAGRAVRACRTLAPEVDGASVVTIEGLGTVERPHPLQRAFVAADAVQCGFCTPGMIMASAALLERNPHPSRAQIARWIGSNLCRCTGYQGIVDAIDWVASGEQGSPRRWPTAYGHAGVSGPAELPTAWRTDALEKATGRALYAADIAVDGMLHAMALRSPHPHAEIVRIDTGRARALSGVEAVLVAGDIPGRNSFGRKVKDQPVLAEHRVRQVGDPVALVVARTRDAAAAALDLIEVDYRLLPALADPAGALAEGAPEIHPGGNLLADNRLRSGDIAEGFARADIIVDEWYTTPWNEHAYLEPDAALAYMDGDTLVLRSSTQHSHYHRAEVARTLGLPVERVRVLPTIVGGAFGGKTDISCQCLVALAAFRTGRPVRIVYTRAETFACTTKRHPYQIHCRTGVTRDGDLTALELDMLADTGAYASTGPGRMIKTFSSATGPYRWPNVDFHGRVVYTNNPPAGSMRGPGTTQVAFAVESQLDLVAERLGMDPLELRLRNRLRKGDRLLSGQVLEDDPPYAATVEAVRPHYRDALERCAAAHDGRGTRRRGVGVASIWYGIGGGPRTARSPEGGAPTPGRAALDLLHDGSIVLRTGVVDLGQGSDTALGLIAAEELGLPLAALAVRTGDTGSTANAGPSGGSRVTHFVGNAVRNAARALVDEVLRSASGLLDRPVGELELRDGQVRDRTDPEHGVSLSEIASARGEAGLPNTFEGVFETDVPAFDAGSGLGESYPAYVTATELAEVEVDTVTGAIRVLRVVAAHDVGRPVFVPGVIGQIEGGIAMGVGFALKEDFVPGKTRGFKEYLVPRMRDVPEIVSILVTDEGGSAASQAKGVAECSNMVVGPAIVNAIANATGVRVRDLPARLPANADAPRSRAARSG